MPSLTLTVDQVFTLVEQLPAEQQEQLLTRLIAGQWPAWIDLSSDGQPAAREAARERGHEWERLSDDERLRLVDDIIHES